MRWLGIFHGFCLILIRYFNMQSKSEKEEHLKMIKKGDLDIIVGTHSLLGSRVMYNNLGLLVVDEEQVHLQSLSFSFLATL